MVARINTLMSHMKEGVQFVADKEKEIAKLGGSRDAYVGAVLEAAEIVDKT
jgi:hypothetical protein